MPGRSEVLTGRSFTTTLDFPDEPEWEPLERLARIVWQTPELPQFHPDEFMYMVAVRNQRLRLRIHLYKHIDTRCYLNLDDAGHAYAYQPGKADHDLDRPTSGAGTGATAALLTRLPASVSGSSRHSGSTVHSHPRSGRNEQAEPACGS